MNKRSIPAILIIGIAVIILVLVGVFVIIFLSHSAQGPSTQTGTTFPVSNEPQPTSNPQTYPGITTVETTSGSTLLVKDFIHATSTIEDPQDRGVYVLASNSNFCLKGDNCPPDAAPTTEYQISYDSKYALFTILLLTEPLGKARTDAESYLANELGITLDQLCSLKYTVGTTINISDVYGGEELGLNGCPDSATLP